MSSLSRELVFLILQFLDEEKFKETVHKLEQESGFFFNMKYFEDEVHNGNWNEVEKYLSGFTKVDDNRYSMKIFFEIRKPKYLEVLDRRMTMESSDFDAKVFRHYFMRRKDYNQKGFGHEEESLQRISRQYAKARILSRN